VNANVRHGQELSSIIRPIARQLRARPEVPAGRQGLGERLGPVHPVPGLHPASEKTALHHRRHRVAEPKPAGTSRATTRSSSCCGWRSSISRTSGPANAPRAAAKPASAATSPTPHRGTTRHGAGARHSTSSPPRRLPRTDQVKAENSPNLKDLYAPEVTSSSGRRRRAVQERQPHGLGRLRAGWAPVPAVCGRVRRPSPSAGGAAIGELGRSRRGHSRA
jgi:hypothetical protein